MGKVRYVSRNFPLEQAHPLARKAAEISACAAEQGKYWELHDRFFSDQKKLALSNLSDNATAIGADLVLLEKRVTTGKYAANIGSDLEEARDLGVGATPRFFIGYSDANNQSRIRAVRSIIGNAPYREFQKAIGDALEASQRGTKDGQ